MRKTLKTVVIVLAVIAIIGLAGDILLESFHRKYSTKPGGDFYEYNHAFTLIDSETSVFNGFSLYLMYSVDSDYSESIYEYLKTTDDWKLLPISPGTRGDIIDRVFDFPKDYYEYLNFENTSGSDAKGVYSYSERNYEGWEIYTFDIFLTEDNILIQGLFMR